MPNPVAANDLQPISGSVQTSRISYGVETAGKNYGQNYNSTTWYSDIPNDGQRYTIITDNYTANYYVSRSQAEGGYVEGGLPAVDEYSAPVFWQTVGTSSLDVITIVNGLPDRVGQIPFVSGAEALNWVASSSNYFAVGPGYYNQIDADQLRLYLDANQIISYPTTQSTWYDLSGNTKNGTLYNGPTFSAVSGAIVFDGADDYVQGPIPNQNPAEATLEIWYNTTADEAFPGENRLLSIGLGSNIPGATGVGISLRLRDDRVGFAARKADNSGYWDIFSGATVIDGIWKHVIGTFDTTSLKRYENGVLTEQTATGQNYYTASDGYSIGGPYAYFDGKIAKARFYSKRLTADEVLQNYYGGPIVTSDLEFAIDAGNLVSYPKSGTTAYDLTGNTNATLRNGTGFDNAFGGTWTFDGVDDYIDVSGVEDFSGPNQLTVECWAKSDNPLWNENGYLVSRRNQFIIHPQISNTNVYFYVNLGGNYYSTQADPGDITQWHHYVLTYDGSQIKCYIDGIFRSLQNQSGALTPDTGVVTIGRDDGLARYLDGDIASVRLYRRALTADEVLQNYNATQ